MNINEHALGTGMPRRPDYVILSGGGSLVKPGSVSPEDEALFSAWVDSLAREKTERA